MRDNVFACFGYGSLVNRKTLRTDFLACGPARLAGWRRHWQSRGRDIAPSGFDDIALLSVHRHDGGVIDGMLILEPANNLAALDKREARYQRIAIERNQLSPVNGAFAFELPEKLFLYVGLPAPASDGPAKLLQSYLDAVLSGFLAEFGPSGLDRFFATTIGFDRTVIADRQAPRYPRAVALPPEIAADFDRRLKAAGASLEPAISA